MKLKKSISAVLATVMLLSASCGESSAKERELSKEIVSYDYKYKIETPVDWKLDESAEVKNNESITLYAICDERCIVLGAGVTEIDQDMLPFNNFCNMVIKNINSKYFTTVSAGDFTEKDVNGLKMRYLEIQNLTFSDSEEEIRAWCYIGEIDGFYVMFIAETLESLASDKQREEVEMIISTFQRFEV
ncbi:MAG: hypothetical protein E7510_10045 [Ruminococcus sp.]|nr:hypothetical protein [Ruminococcus sp.]